MHSFPEKRGKKSQDASDNPFQKPNKELKNKSKKAEINDMQLSLFFFFFFFFGVVCLFSVCAQLLSTYFLLLST